MAVAKIRVKGKYIFLDTSYKEGEAKIQKIQIFGWTVSVQENGTVICYKAQKAYDGWHIKRMTITPKGRVKITSIQGEKQSTRKFFLKMTQEEEKQEMDIVIGLSDGWVDSSKCYVRVAEFQKFLDKYCIDAVRKSSPNTYFTLKTIRKVNGEYLHEMIDTDGSLIIISDLERKNDFFSEIITRVRVIDATWVIKTEAQNIKYGVPPITKVLFTSEKDVLQLKFVEEEY